MIRSLFRPLFQFLSPLSLTLCALCWAAAAHAQTAEAPVEHVSTAYTALFLIAFIGGTIGVGWYMWWSDRRESGKKDEKPAGGEHAK